MSRIAKKPIEIPENVSVTVTESMVTIKGPKGELRFNSPVVVQVDGKLVKVGGGDQMAGMARTMIANSVRGVAEEWTKTLELSGTGFRAATTGKQLNLALGYSHPVVVEAGEGVVFEVKENKITVRGADKTRGGEMAAKIRSLRPADGYKHKGFKYEGEKLIKKAGKAAKAGGTASK